MKQINVGAIVAGVLLIVSGLVLLNEHHPIFAFVDLAAGIYLLSISINTIPPSGDGAVAELV